MITKNNVRQFSGDEEMETKYCVEFHGIGYWENGKIRSIDNLFTYDEEKLKETLNGQEIYEKIASIVNSNFSIDSIKKVWERGVQGSSRFTSKSIKEFIRNSVKKHNRGCFLWNDEANKFDLIYYYN